VTLLIRQECDFFGGEKGLLLSRLISEHKGSSQNQCMHVLRKPSQNSDNVNKLCTKKVSCVRKHMLLIEFGIFCSDYQIVLALFHGELL
jgi:hypothetical protein